MWDKKLAWMMWKEKLRSTKQNKTRTGSIKDGSQRNACKQKHWKCNPSQVQTSWRGGGLRQMNLARWTSQGSTLSLSIQAGKSCPTSALCLLDSHTNPVERRDDSTSLSLPLSISSLLLHSTSTQLAVTACFQTIKEKNKTLQAAEQPVAC